MEAFSGRVESRSFMIRGGRVVPQQGSGEFVHRNTQINF